MPSKRTFAEHDAEASTKEALARALRQLAAAKASKEELVQAVYRAAKDSFAALDLPPVKPPAKDARKDPEVAVVMLGDLQLGKRTPTYNSAVCEKRIATQYADKIRRIIDVQRRDHPVKEARVWMLGDLVEGEQIFPGQPWQIDASLYRQVTLDGPRIVGNFLRALLTDLDKVHVTAIIGNHGRLGRRGDHDPASNADRMLYTIVSQLLSHEKRLSWTIPAGDGERHWYAIDRIGNYSSLLFHGDQLGGRLQGTLTRVAVQRKIGGWKSGGIREPFKDVTFGHWHTNYEDAISDCTVRCNGSPESDNTHAQEAYASMSRPSQRLMFVHPRDGIVTSEYKVWLE